MAKKQTMMLFKEKDIIVDTKGIIYEVATVFLGNDYILDCYVVTALSGPKKTKSMVVLGSKQSLYREANKTERLLFGK